jgi:hypothetical protein
MGWDGMGWAGRVSCMGEMRNAYIIFVANPQGKRPCGNIGVDRRIILERILEK